MCDSTEILLVDTQDGDEETVPNMPWGCNEGLMLELVAGRELEKL